MVSECPGQPLLIYKKNVAMEFILNEFKFHVKEFGSSDSRLKPQEPVMM